MKKTAYKIHLFFVDLTILIVTSYFILRKTCNVSLSKHVEAVFLPKAANIIVIFLTLIVAYCLVVKIVDYCIKWFRKEPSPSLHPPHYRCLLNNNKEIEKHICELNAGKLQLSQLDKKHAYETNILLIHSNLYEHIQNAFKEYKLKADDIFISLFHDENFGLEFSKLQSLTFQSHFDPTAHQTSTDVIDISPNGEHRNFAGAKAIKTGNIIACHRIKKSEYETGTEERRKTTKHYLGIPLKIGKNVVALLNIEFHNHNLFNNKKDMTDFYKGEIQSFTYLYEYQIHKKYFFAHIDKKVIKS